MYAGRIVETAGTRDLFARPLHPYTRALQRSIPALQPKGASLYSIEGLPPDLSRPQPGCPFAPRCEHAVAACSSAASTLREAGGAHAHACVRVHAGEI
jgi:oligopeptide transport system ATP-binding protein